MNPTTKKPELTTRRVDGFNIYETNLLRLAESDSSGIIWLVVGKVPRVYFDAAEYLQRLGYLFPTQIGKPDGSRSFGWKLQDEGRAALAILDRAEAA